MNIKKKYKIKKVKHKRVLRNKYRTKIGWFKKYNSVKN